MNKVIEHKGDYDAEIRQLEQEIPGTEQQLAELRVTIARAKEQPAIQATELAQIEKMLQSARDGLETAKDYLFECYGTEAESSALENQQQAEASIVKYERDIAEYKAKRASSAAQDEQKLVRLQDEERQLAQALQDKRIRVVTLQNEKNAAYQAEGKRIFNIIARQCREVVENEKVKRKAAINAKLALNSYVEEAYEKLGGYPELLGQLEREYGVKKESGATRIARTGLAYLDSLILDSESLETAPSLPGGHTLLEVLALSDMEMLGHQWEGGTLGLKQRRALLLRFLEQQKES